MTRYSLVGQPFAPPPATGLNSTLCTTRGANQVPWSAHPAYGGLPPRTRFRRLFSPCATIPVLLDRSFTPGWAEMLSPLCRDLQCVATANFTHCRHHAGDRETQRRTESLWNTLFSLSQVPGASTSNRIATTIMRAPDSNEDLRQRIGSFASPEISPGLFVTSPFFAGSTAG
jgi:hypothetical protein